MPAPVTPRLDVLPPSQRALWTELAAVPPDFALYGGTAIALRYGHRQSVDVDFFSHGTFDPGTLKEQIPFLAKAAVVQDDFNPHITLKALCYFDDVELAALPKAVRHRLVTAVAAVNPDRLPILTPIKPPGEIRR